MQRNNPTVAAKLAVARIYLNGREVPLVGYNINGSNDFKLRDIGRLFDFAVIYNPDLKRIEIVTAKGYGEE